MLRVILFTALFMVSIDASAKGKTKIRVDKSGGETSITVDDDVTIIVGSGDGKGTTVTDGGKVTAVSDDGSNGKSSTVEEVTAAGKKVTVVDADIIKTGDTAIKTDVKDNSALQVSAAASARTFDQKETIILNNEDQTKKSFVTYTIDKTVDANEVSHYEMKAGEEKFEAGNELTFDSVLIAKNLIERMRDKDYDVQIKRLKSILNTDSPENFTKLLFGEGGEFSHFRGLLEHGRDATDTNLKQGNAIEANLGVGASVREREVFATGMLRTSDDKYIKIKDLLASGVKLNAETGRVKLLKSTAYHLVKESLDKAEGLSDEIKEKTVSALCYANCNVSANLGDWMAGLVQLTTYEHSPLSQVYCLMKEFSGKCDEGSLSDVLEHYSEELPDDFDCRKKTVIKEEESEEKDIKIVLERSSYSKSKEYARYRVKLEGDDVDKVDGSGSFFWFCKDDEDQKCEEHEDETAVSFDEIKDIEFEISVHYRATKDGDDLVEPVTITVNLDCDSDDEKCEEDEEDEEDEDKKDKKYTWEDFYQDTGMERSYPPPPPRFQPTMLPPRRGMSVTPGVP